MIILLLAWLYPVNIIETIHINNRFFTNPIIKKAQLKTNISIKNNFWISIFSSILWTILDTKNHTILAHHITKPIYTIGNHKLCKYGSLKVFTGQLLNHTIIEKIAILQNPVFFVAFIIEIKSWNLVLMDFFCFFSGNDCFSLGGATKVNATISQTTSKINQTWKGNLKLIWVKKGRTTISPALKRETLHHILHHIFVNLLSSHSHSKVSWKKATFAPELKANPNAIQTDPKMK